MLCTFTKKPRKRCTQVAQPITPLDRPPRILAKLLVHLLAVSSFTHTSMSNACAGSSADGILGLRVGGLFIILVRRCGRQQPPSDPPHSVFLQVTSLVGTLFPVIAKRVPFLRRRVPGSVFEFAK